MNQINIGINSQDKILLLCKMNSKAGIIRNRFRLLALIHIILIGMLIFTVSYSKWFKIELDNDHFINS